MPTNTDLEYRIAKSQGNWETVSFGQETVAASGTAEPLNGGTSLAVPDGATVEIAPLPGNTDSVYIGDSSVSTSTGRALASGDPPARLNVTDVSTIYVDAGTAGEGVSWIVESD